MKSKKLRLRNKSKVKKAKRTLKLKTFNGGAAAAEPITLFYPIESVQLDLGFVDRKVNDETTALLCYKEVTEDLEGFRTRSKQDSFSLLHRELTKIQNSMENLMSLNLPTGKCKPELNEINESIRTVNDMRDFFNDNLNDTRIAPYFAPMSQATKKELLTHIKTALYSTTGLQLDRSYKHLLDDKLAFTSERLPAMTITDANGQPVNIQLEPKKKFNFLKDKVLSLLQIAGNRINSTTFDTVKKTIRGDKDFKKQQVLIQDCLEYMDECNVLDFSSIAYVPRLDEITGISTNNRCDVIIAICIAGLSEFLIPESSYYFLQSNDTIRHDFVPVYDPAPPHQTTIRTDFKLWQTYHCIGELRPENMLRVDCKFTINIKARYESPNTGSVIATLINIDQNKLRECFTTYCDDNKITPNDMLAILLSSFKGDIHQKQILANLIRFADDMFSYTYDNSCGAHGGGDLNAAALAYPSINLGVESQYRLFRRATYAHYAGGVMGDIVKTVAVVVHGIPGTFNVCETNTFNLRTSRTSFKDKLNLLRGLMPEKVCLQHMSGRHFILGNVPQMREALKRYILRFTDIILKNVCNKSALILLENPNDSEISVGGSLATPMIPLVKLALLKLLIPITSIETIGQISAAGPNGFFLSPYLRLEITELAPRIIQSLSCDDECKLFIRDLLTTAGFFSKPVGISVQATVEASNDEYVLDNQEATIHKEAYGYGQAEGQLPAGPKRRLQIVPQYFLDSFITYFYGEYTQKKQFALEMEDKISVQDVEYSKLLTDLEDVASKSRSKLIDTDEERSDAFKLLNKFFTKRHNLPEMSGAAKNTFLTKVSLLTS